MNAQLWKTVTALPNRHSIRAEFWCPKLSIFFGMTKEEFDLLDPAALWEDAHYKLPLTPAV